MNLHLKWHNLMNQSGSLLKKIDVVDRAIVVVCIVKNSSNLKSFNFRAPYKGFLKARLFYCKNQLKSEII